jgi:hypothetical protein
MLAPRPRSLNISSAKGWEMACFQTENPNLGKFCKAFDRKMLIYFIAIWNILATFGISYDHLAHFCSFFPVLVSCMYVPRKIRKIWQPWFSL